MAKSKEDQLADKVGAAAAAAVDVAGPEIKSLTVEFQHSGECPFRMVVADDVAPLVGLAWVPADTFSSTPDTTPVSQSLGDGEK